MGIYILISVLIIIACFLQILIVLVQNSKGGGLAANFTSAGQTMGVRKTADFLEKSTWTIAIGIFVLCIVATAAIPRGGATQHSRIESQIQNAVDPSAVPTLPTATPPSANGGTPSQQTGKDNPKK
jgi:preprotein translocase subunit SecG